MARNFSQSYGICSNLHLATYEAVMRRTKSCNLTRNNTVYQVEERMLLVSTSHAQSCATSCIMSFFSSYRTLEARLHLPTLRPFSWRFWSKEKMVKNLLEKIYSGHQYYLYKCIVRRVRKSRTKFVNFCKSPQKSHE